jgi:hypothetical protein
MKPQTLSSPEARGAMKPAGDQCRCACGSMLARVVREGLELKCRKCKSLILITHEELIEMYKQLDFGPSPSAPTSIPVPPAGFDLRPRRRG